MGVGGGRYWPGTGGATGRTDTAERYERVVEAVRTPGRGTEAGLD
ncbi:hypothetical protein [Streptomyces yangpuensis]